MSYYTLPKKTADFDIDPVITNSAIISPFISFSLYHYLITINDQLKKIENSDMFLSSMAYENIFIFLNKIINPYEFIFTKVPNSKLSVSKLKPPTNLFYILMEIVNIFNLMDCFFGRNIKTLSFGINADSVIEFMNMLREDNKDVHLKSSVPVEKSKILFCESNYEFRLLTYDFLYYELDDKDYLSIKNYTLGMIYILCNLFFHQSANGVAIIKIDNIFYKPLIEILYILSSVYEKVYIIKPTLSNVITNERYIICKNFIVNLQIIKLYYSYFLNLNSLLKNLKKDEELESLLKNKIPYYFVNKVEESNIIIGQQQLEFMEQLICLYKNKNKEDKLENLKKLHIQKCIQWCDKFKIPYNKFTDKVNIFLNGYKSYNENIEHATNNLFLTIKDDVEFENIVIIEDEINYDSSSEESESEINIIDCD